MRPIIAILLSGSLLIAAFERIPQSPLQVATGFSNLVQVESPLSLLSRPSSLTRIHRLTPALFYSSPFQLPQLTHYGAYVAFPVLSFTAGTGFSTFGNKLYRESTASVGAATIIGNDLTFGVVLNIRELSIKNYGSSYSIGISASVDYNLSDLAKWSLVYHNMNAPAIGISDEFLPQTVATGITVAPDATIGSSVELEKDLEFDARYKFGILWQPLSNLTIASGFINHPAQLTGGFSFRIKGKQISYAIATHAELAISQVFAFQFALP